MIDKETIERFFLQQCSMDEAAEVLSYFDEYPDALQKYLQEGKSLAMVEQLPTQKTAELWKKIQLETTRNNTPIAYRRWLAIAASLIITLSATWLFFKQQKTATPPVASTIEKLIDTTNTGNIKIAFHLPDSSYVELMPNSTLTYPEIFKNVDRKVSLEGEAYFKVVKKEKVPFIVISEGLSITVVGTIFTVKTFKVRSEIQVKLLEGKVAVAAADSILPIMDKTVILKPGETLNFNKRTNTFVVLNEKHSKATTSDNTNKPTKNQSTGISAENWYMFNNQALTEVFSELGRIYNKKIKFNNQEIKGMTFIGKLDKTDSLESILQSIALLNNLNVTEQNGVYIIRKK
jgi:ferric-dicitrate binding protein FerR (iron transport regulator)